MTKTELALCARTQVRRMTQLCRSMLNLDVERDVILSHLRDASKIGCRLATSETSAVSRAGPEVTFSLQEPYSYAECLSSFGSTYADLKLPEEAAEYFDKSASAFEIEQQDSFRSGAELYVVFDQLFSHFHVSITSHKNITHSCRMKITGKATLECKCDCDENSNSNARTQVQCCNHVR